MASWMLERNESEDVWCLQSIPYNELYIHLMRPMQQMLRNIAVSGQKKHVIVNKTLNRFRYIPL